MTLPARIDGALRRLTDAQWVPQLFVRSRDDIQMP
jgi:hypothetical protein